MKFTREDLRNLAISHTLFTPTTLSEAINQLGFIQADPIRSPARAQDLILRLRVLDYKVGDLEKNYPDLGIEEDYLYAYGFMTRDLQRFLHPRKAVSLTPLEKKILRIAQQAKLPLNTKELENLFGKERVINAWGGHSLAIKEALDNLHHAGFLRVSGRDNGRRIYIVNNNLEQKLTAEERLQELVLAIVNILYPITERTLQESLFHIRKHIGNTKQVIDRLVKSSRLERHTIDNLIYVWPTDAMKGAVSSQMNEVKIVSPFDPLVWDRRRFGHLWGWPYRFEAYTPPSKRVRGYYAMPLLWRDQMVGWTNISVQKGSMLVETGYIHGAPHDPDYKTELKEELKNMEDFLGLNK